MHFYGYTANILVRSTFFSTPYLSRNKYDLFTDLCYTKKSYLLTIFLSNKKNTSNIYVLKLMFQVCHDCP